jgi:hypothetical protein
MGNSHSMGSSRNIRSSPQGYPQQQYPQQQPQAYPQQQYAPQSQPYYGR